VLIVILMVAVAYLAGRFFSSREGYLEVIAPVTPVYRFTTGIAALLIFVSGVAGIVPAFAGEVLNSSAIAQSVLLMLAGICLIGLAHEASGQKNLRGAYPFSIVPEIAFTFWLLIYYRSSQKNPTMLTFVFILLALAASVFAFYFNASYVFGRKAPQKFVFSHCVAIYFLVMSLADNIGFEKKLCFIGLALYFTVNLSRFAANMIPKKKARLATTASEPDIEMLTEDASEDDIGEDEPTAMTEKMIENS